MESWSSPRKGCLHVSRRWAHRYPPAKRHVCPPQVSSRVGQNARRQSGPLLPSPALQITGYHFHACHHAYHRKIARNVTPNLPKAVCAREGYAEEKKAFRPIWRRSTGTSDCRCNSATQRIHKHKHTPRARSEPRGESCPTRMGGVVSQPTESSACGDTHSVAGECHIADTPRGERCTTMRRTGGRSSCIVVVVARLGAGKRARSHDIFFGRRIPHVTRAVVRVFRGRGHENIRWCQGKRGLEAWKDMHFLGCVRPVTVPTCKKEAVHI